MIRRFAEVQPGQFFQFRGRRYQKVALSMAHDEQRRGCVFLADTEVLVELH